MGTIDQTVTWSSSNPAAVTVSSTGAVTGVGPGIAHITGTKIQNGVTSKCYYTVGCYTNTVNLTVMYDGGYSTRHSDASARIVNQLKTIQFEFVKQCGIYVNYTEPVQFTSLADTCTMGAYAACACGGEDCTDTEIDDKTGNYIKHTYHHKNMRNVLFGTNPVLNSKTARLIYIGHPLCSEYGSSCSPVTADGITFSAFAMASVFAIGDTESYERFVAVHEFGHLFEAIDHYGGSNGIDTDDMVSMYPDKGYDYDCIYGDNYMNPDVMAQYTICDGCKSRIRDYADRYTP